jgi:hypothetical protein
MRVPRNFLQSAFAIFVASACASASCRAQKATQVDTVAVRRRVVAAEMRFFTRWSLAWKASEATRHFFQLPGAADQEPGVHCHANAPMSLSQASVLIPSQVTAFSVCGAWFRHGGSALDERSLIDNALGLSKTDSIRGARAELIAILDSLRIVVPSNDFVVGQLTRFLIDQADTSAALATVNDCKGTTAWCLALKGYVLGSVGRVTSADSAFSKMLSALDGDARCRWSDIRVLLPPDERSAYARASCARRDSLSARFWWLGDPLWMVPGNDRRTEQFMRVATLALRTAVERDERFHWSPKVGGDARRELVLRYGWPSYAYWGGVGVDAEHSGWLASRDQRGSPDNEPYVLYEYTISANPSNTGVENRTRPVWRERRRAGGESS